MEYTDIPRSLIYKERTDLKQFGVQVIGTVNQQLFIMLKELFKATDRAKEIFLRCFNNAYYICTIIPFEDFPETQVAEYEKLLMKEECYALEQVCTVSMAMVCKLLQAYDARWRHVGNDLINNIQYRFTHYRWYHSGAANLFIEMLEKEHTNGLYLPQNEFAPRDIIEAIENVDANDLAIGVISVCDRLALLDDSHKRTYGADLAIARLNDNLRKIKEEWGYDPQTNSFNPNIAYDSQTDEFFFKKTELIKEAVEYITRHYPTKKKDSKDKPVNTLQKPDTDDHLTKINELEAKLSLQNKQLVEAQKKIDEFMQPVEELTAEQKVRMAFALQLLKAAGLTDEILKKRGNKAKVATIMSLLTGISSNNSRGNKAQICQTFLTDKKFYPRTENMETLIRLNTLCAELDINVSLLLESQSNK